MLIFKTVPPTAHEWEGPIEDGRDEDRRSEVLKINIQFILINKFVYRFNGKAGPVAVCRSIEAVVYKAVYRRGGNVETGV